MPKVTVLRSFNKTPQGDLADIGETIEVDDTRAQELVRLGLGSPGGCRQDGSGAPEQDGSRAREQGPSRPQRKEGEAMTTEPATPA